VPEGNTYKTKKQGSRSIYSIYSLNIPGKVYIWVKVALTLHKAREVIKK